MTELIRLSRYNREVIVRIRYAPAYGWRSLWRVIRGDLGFDPPIKRQGAQFTMTEGQQRTVEAAAADMKPLTAGYVIDAGGGQVGIMVDRSTMDYPTVGTRVVLYEFTTAAATFRCGHGRLGTERCPMCDAGIETESVKCTTGDHLDEPAAGDAWAGDEDQPDQRVPYCAECLAVLGDDFGARWWEAAPMLAEILKDPSTTTTATAELFGVIVAVILVAIAIWVAIVFWRESR